MATDSPSLILQRAADKLEELAEAATPGPWRYHDTWLPHGGHTATVGSDAQPKSPLVAWLPTHETEPWGNERRAFPNAMWMAAMCPAVARPIANILRGVAFTLDCHPEYADIERNYITLAELVLRDCTIWGRRESATVSAEGKERSDPSSPSRTSGISVEEETTQ